MGGRWVTAEQEGWWAAQFGKSPRRMGPAEVYTILEGDGGSGEEEESGAGEWEAGPEGGQGLRRAGQQWH